MVRGNRRRNGRLYRRGNGIRNPQRGRHPQAALRGHSGRQRILQVNRRGRGGQQPDSEENIRFRYWPAFNNHVGRARNNRGRQRQANRPRPYQPADFPFIAGRIDQMDNIPIEVRPLQHHSHYGRRMRRGGPSRVGRGVPRRLGPTGPRRLVRGRPPRFGHSRPPRFGRSRPPRFGRGLLRERGLLAASIPFIKINPKNLTIGTTNWYRTQHNINAGLKILKKYKKQNVQKYKYKRNKKPKVKCEPKRTPALRDPSQLFMRQVIKKSNLAEEDVGITEYISQNDGFTGVLKSRFSDFQVNEIDLNGKVLELNDMQIPKEDKKILEPEAIALLKNELADIIPPSTWEKLDKMAAAKLALRIGFEPIIIDIDGFTKENRKKIHTAIKEIYLKKLNSTTEDMVATTDEGNVQRRVIKISAPKINERSRNEWKFPGDYVHFLVYKENLDTNMVASTIADRMRIRGSLVSYCGTKDKRAKTTQKFCIRYRSPSLIVASVRSFHAIQIGNFEFSNKGLKLGDLKGNRFRIALRHVDGNRDHIERCLMDLDKNGFINYFGMQRFGNAASVPTFEVGEAILKSNYKLAVDLIMKPRENEHFIMSDIRKFWADTHDANGTLAMFQRIKCIERTLMAALCRNDANNYCTALCQIPRNTLSLYLHAFQSVIFNRIASRRIKEFGLDIIVGDLVYRNPDEMDMPYDFYNWPEEPPTQCSKFKSMVKAITAEDIASGLYAIKDVVLTLPGHDVSYPENVVGEWYRDMLLEKGLTSASLRNKNRTFSLPGAYRKLIIWPQELCWELCAYDNADETLIASDWEKMHGCIITPKQEGIYKALILEFSLPASTYATMMLRELLKHDTSAANQMFIEQAELGKKRDCDEMDELMDIDG